MASTVNHAAQTRPGGRTARVTRQIHSAVIDLLTTRGHDSCTFQNVADRAGVERSTLYRRYSDRWTMIIDAYASRAELEVVIEPTGRFEEDLRTLVRRFSQFWSTKLAESMLAMMLAARGTPAQDRVVAFVDRRYREFDPMFDAAISSGDLPATIDRREILERTAGAVIFHMLVANEIVDEVWVDKLAADLRRLYRPDKETAS